MLRPICFSPVLFAFYPEVCDRCGNLVAAHQPAAPPDMAKEASYTKSMWKVMLQLGAGVYNRYGYDGAISDHDSLELWVHLNTCGIDFDAMKLPGTQHLRDYDDNTVKVLGGRLTCTCGEYKDTQIVLPGFVFGQLVWHHLHTDPDGA